MKIFNVACTFLCVAGIADAFVQHRSPLNLGIASRNKLEMMDNTHLLLADGGDDSAVIKTILITLTLGGGLIPATIGANM